MSTAEQQRETTSTRPSTDSTTRVPDAGPPDRLLVPVLAGTGGAGRSSLAALLAQQLATSLGSTVVLDTGHPNTSPWRGWLTAPAFALPPGEPARLRAPDRVTVRVLTDTRPRPTPRPPARVDVATWAGHPALGDYRCRVVDTDTPLLAKAHLGADPAGPVGWLCQPGALPVLCVPASPKGVADAQNLITLLERLALPVHHVTVAVVAVAAGRVPRRVLAGLTLLEPRIAAIVPIPHDTWVRVSGGVRIDRAGRPVRRAVTVLAATLTDLATSVTTEATAADALRSPGQQPGAAIAPDTTAAAATAVAASAALIHSR